MTSQVNFRINISSAGSEIFKQLKNDTQQLRVETLKLQEEIKKGSALKFKITPSLNLSDLYRSIESSTKSSEESLLSVLHEGADAYKVFDWNLFAQHPQKLSERNGKGDSGLEPFFSKTTVSAIQLEEILLRILGESDELFQIYERLNPQQKSTFSIIAKEVGVDKIMMDAESLRAVYDVTFEEIQSEITGYILELQDAVSSNSNASATVGELNEKYGDLIGTFSEAEEWLYQLRLRGTEMSKYFGNQAEIVAMKSVFEDWTGCVKNSSASLYECEDVLDSISERFGRVQTQLAEGMSAVSSNPYAVQWDEQNLSSLLYAIQRQRLLVANLAGADEISAKYESQLLAKMEARAEELAKVHGLLDRWGSIDHLVERAKKPGILKSNASSRSAIDGLSRAEIKRQLEEIDKEILYQQTLRKKATTDSLAGIDAEINHLNGLKTALESGAHSPLTIEQIETYEQLEREIGYYEAALKRATVTERAEIQVQINALRGLREEWDNTLSALDVPEDIGKLNTIEQLSEAIGYYDDRIKKASAGEIEALQRTKMLLEGKAEALKRLTELPAMQDELADLGGLDSKSLKMELELIGLEGVRDKIRSLQRMLDDTKNPLDAGQRKEVNRLIASWSVYEGKLQRSKVTFKGTWGAMRGAGDGIIQMTEALRGNGNAWEKVTGVMDGMIGFYDSISGIVGIIRAMTVTTHAHTAAKTAEAAATVTATTAQGVEAGMAETQAAAQIPVIVANKLAAASFLELAAASYFAAHAYIPFAGFGIAAGFVAASVAMTKGIGAMPFANGGVIYGPTLGLMGEYAGASNNPEVVAPLDKLRGLIQPVDAFGGGGTVEFKIKGRSLVGIYNRETNLKNRT